MPGIIYEQNISKSNHVCQTISECHHRKVPQKNDKSLCIHCIPSQQWSLFNRIIGMIQYRLACVAFIKVLSTARWILTGFYNIYWSTIQYHSNVISFSVAWYLWPEERESMTTSSNNLPSESCIDSHKLGAMIQDSIHGCEISPFLNSETTEWYCAHCVLTEEV
jgi:hypothetical protein